MEKVKISKQIADALKTYDGCNMNMIFYEIVSTEPSKRNDVLTTDALTLWEFGNKRGWFALADVLSGKYEIEKTPDEEAIQWCIKTDSIARGKSAHDVVMAIKHILNKGE